MRGRHNKSSLRKRRKGQRPVFFTAVFVLSALVICALVAYGWYRDNRMSNFNGRAELYVTADMYCEDIVRELESQLEIKDRGRLVNVLKRNDVDASLKPGHYSVDSKCSSRYVARMLVSGWQTPVRFTLSGTMRLKSDISHRICRQLNIDSLAVMDILNDRDFLADLGFTPENVFALFLPDTYEVYWDLSVESLMRRMKKEYDAYWTESNRKKAGKLGLSQLQVSTLASIVTSESVRKDEYARIAGVYLNRLEIGMLLQADPTVAYCFGYKPSRILNKHLAVDSPYNTYKYPGLPPGPICVPEKTALDAVLNPDFGTADGRCGRGGNLYFCANSDFSGRHVFARSLTEHNRNAAVFRKELNRRKIK